jgi:predicted ribosome quality control (RQC) complex YloA/Tae2 family protein
MSFDGSFTHAMVHELNHLVSGGRVTKINQPYNNEIIVTIRSHQQNYPILMSANPNYARVQVTEIPYVNPLTPTNFTMTLRKHLSGAVLKKVTQLKNDRVINFHFTTRNEIGDLKEMVIAVEIMARHSNIILIDTQDDMRIIDAIKRISADKNRYRTILPGDQYLTPPNQQMENPFTFQAWDVLQQLITDFPNQDVLAEQLQKRLQGLSSHTVLALAQSLHTDANVQTNFQSFFSHFDHPQPTLIHTTQQNDFTVYPFNLTAGTQYTSFKTLSALLDTYYVQKARQNRVKEKGGVLIKVARKELKKNRNKRKKLMRTLDQTKHADDYRIKGEILTTYLYQMKKGQSQIELPNFYDNNAPIKIQLSNQLSPSENAQKYFKHYQKAKNAVGFVNEQLNVTNAEIDYFENVLAQIELAEPADLDDIKVELQHGGYLKHYNQETKKNKPKRHHISKPETFFTSDGTAILVGKNNLQNDKLTNQTADKRDTWLHTQKIHGSHVIIKDFAPGESTLETAAMLAAYFSKAQASANVPVDFTKVKYVKKPNGAKPGLVIYDHQQTMFVTPSYEFVEQLRKNQPNN